MGRQVELSDEILEGRPVHPVPDDDELRARLAFQDVRDRPDEIDKPRGLQRVVERHDGKEDGIARMETVLPADDVLVSDERSGHGPWVRYGHIRLETVPRRLPREQVGGHGGNDVTPVQEESEQTTPQTSGARRGVKGKDDSQPRTKQLVANRRKKEPPVPVDMNCLRPLSVNLPEDGA